MRSNNNLVLCLLLVSAITVTRGSGASHEMPPCGGVLDESFFPLLPPPQKPVPMQKKQKAATKRLDKALDKLRASLKKGKLTTEEWETALQNVGDDIDPRLPCLHREQFHLEG